MGYLSCNGESAIVTCDPYNWDLTKKNNRTNKLIKHFKIRDFSYLDLESATNGFSPDSFLGKGSHGSVYRAVLDDGKLIAAVKRTMINNTTSHSNNINNSPAENEIEILSRIRSPRLVNLLGFGTDSSQRKLIVVEFMPNGSLYDLLHNEPRPPGWGRRVRFAVQIARAVQHLHCSTPPVIHRDIKSSNVLMDCKWNARLGDFGLALRGHVEDVRIRCTPPAGTLGYLDPGYLAPGDLSAKSDVFSFGILLLEIISGRNAIDLNFSPPSVVDWAAPLIRCGDYAGICDPRIGPPGDPVVIRQLAMLASRCVRSTAAKRPSMSDVVDWLRAVKRTSASPIWNNIGRRVRISSPSIKYEALDDGTETNNKTLRLGSRRNGKVSSVPVVEVGTEASGTSINDRVSRSKSIGSVREIIKSGPSDSIGKRRGGLAVKMPTVRMSKSRSMGMLQSSTGLIVQRNGVNVTHILKSPNNDDNNVGEIEESQLLINWEKGGPEGDL